MLKLPTKINGLLVVKKGKLLWLTCFALVVTACMSWGLYQWFESGMIYAPSKARHGSWMHYSDDPDIFIYHALMQLLCFVFFGVGSLILSRMLLLHRYVDPDAEPLPISEDR